MSDAANMFKKLAQNRQKSTSPETAAKTKEESKPVPESNPSEKAKKTASEPSPEKKLPEPAIAPEESNKKRGRPATGKRSDPDWIGRTYYIRKENDFDVEDELVKLKRAGINLDKSELVDFLLAAWVKCRNGENIDIQMSEISPRRKDELP
ncbi:MAG TPA: hypothetical protein V6C71_00710 [Coleofasciculaceae cyanobacterium]|jgi:hypothetical protein